MVRALAHGAMGHWIDHSWWTHSVISRSSQCSTTGIAKATGITKAVVCAVLSVGLLTGKSSPCGGSWFPLSLSEWFFSICLTPYNRK